MATVVLDAGHGGSDFGATYLGRMEKDDNLRLTLAVGRILENAGVNVIYTRTGDVYESPAEKAAKANSSCVFSKRSMRAAFSAWVVGSGSLAAGVPVRLE